MSIPIHPDKQSGGSGFFLQGMPLLQKFHADETKVSPG